MNSRTLIAVTAAIGLFGLTACSDDAGQEEARSLQLSTWLAPDTPHGIALQTFADDVEGATDGTLTIELFWSASLLEADRTLQGVSAGQAEMGYLNNSYFPSDLPISQYVALPFHSQDMDAATFAWNEMLDVNDDFKEEWASHNMVNLGMHTNTPMIISAPDSPDSYEWLSDKQIRATSLTGNAVDMAGGNPIGLPITEVYESLQRGVIDGYTSMNLGTLPSLSLQEVSPHVADPGLGIYTFSALVVNESTFESLSDNEQSAMRTAAEGFYDVYRDAVDEVDANACELIQEANGTAIVWPEEEVQQWADAVGDTLENQWRDEVTADGVDAEAFITQYHEQYDQAASDQSETMMQNCADR